MTEQKMKLKENRERWHLAKTDDAQIKAFAEKLDIDFLLAKILWVRQIEDRDIERIKAFLNPPKALIMDYSLVSDPGELKKAFERVKTALKNKEMIFINGDPDADGISGATILVEGLRYLGADIVYDFPVRSREGHGLQTRIIDEAKRRGVNLVITTDCGSKDIQVAGYAKEQGIDVIITDHHILGRNIPDVYAMVNPNMVKKPTLFKELSGAGVSFKFIIGIFDIMKVDMPEPLINFLLTMVSFGTLSDRMSMLNKMNRVMISDGVTALNHTNREGLKALKKVCMEIHDVIKPRHLTRTIIPRLNAPGRIGDPEQGIPGSNVVVDLLLIGSGKENAKKANKVIEVFNKVLGVEKELKEAHGLAASNALDAAASVDDINERRKYITNKIEEEINHMVEEQIDPDHDRVALIQGKNWNPGVIGIDTDRLKERFLRPAMILTTYDGNPYIRGSVRSIPNINMYKILDYISDEFEHNHNNPLFQVEINTADGTRYINAFGGHAQACGFSFHEDKRDEFVALLKREMAKIDENQFHYSYDIIDKIPFSRIGQKLIKTCNKLSPYGQTFEFPIFYLQGCTLSKGSSFGNKYQELQKPHVNFKVKEMPKKKKLTPLLEFDAVGFNLWEKFCFMKANYEEDTRFDVIFTIEENLRRRGRSKSKRQEIRLNVQDIRKSGKNVDSFAMSQDEGR